MEPGTQEHHAGIGLDQRGDVGADQRIEIGGADVHAAEDMGAEILGRFVRRARDQQVIAGADERQDRIGHRRGAAGVQHAAGAALQFYHRILQGEVGQRAASAVKQLAVGALRGGMLLAATESKTKEEARCVTGLTEPWV